MICFARRRFAEELNFWIRWADKTQALHLGDLNDQTKYEHSHRYTALSSSGWIVTSLHHPP